ENVRKNWLGAIAVTLDIKPRDNGAPVLALMLSSGRWSGGLPCVVVNVIPCVVNTQGSGINGVTGVQAGMGPIGNSSNVISSCAPKAASRGGRLVNRVSTAWAGVTRTKIVSVIK